MIDIMKASPRQLRRYMARTRIVDGKRGARAISMRVIDEVMSRRSLSTRTYAIRSCLGLMTKPACLKSSKVRT